MREFGGVYPAVVIANVDPANGGRVQVRLPQLGGPGHGSYEAWARVATLMAGDNSGTWFIPDVQDEVLVAFEGGDMTRPCVLGSMWNRNHSPPETMAAGNDRKVLRSRSGVKITLDDRNGQQGFIVETPGGQRILLRDAPGSVEITDGNGNSVKLDPNGLTVNVAAKVTLHAAAVEVNAGVVTVNAGMSNFSGVVKCDTLISNSVVSASYTPGAGNVM
jgi:uncharacterized protein involved in type VI secretion and phage assembly